jgi:hypothetical protein
METGVTEREMTVERGSLRRSVEQAMRFGRPSQLSIDGNGTLSIYPDQHCYVTDIQDWATVYSVGAERIQLRPTMWGAPPSISLPLEELRWRAAFHDHQLPADRAADARHDLLQLLSWPDLPGLPDELLAPVTRICALLWRKPTVAYLVPRILQLAPESVFPLVRVLEEFGHVAAVHGAPREAALQPIAARAEHAPAAPEAAPAAPPMLARLWQRLVGFQVAG